MLGDLSRSGSLTIRPEGAGSPPRVPSRRLTRSMLSAFLPEVQLWHWATLIVGVIVFCLTFLGGLLLIRKRRRTDGLLAAALRALREQDEGDEAGRRGKNRRRDKLV